MPSPLHDHDDQVPVPIWGLAARFDGRELECLRRTTYGSGQRVTGTDQKSLPGFMADEDR